jgi:glucosylceramidase
MKIFILPIAILIATAATLPLHGQNYTHNPTVTIYTTALNTNLRLSNTGKATFSKSKKTDTSVSAITINPDEKFQTLLGIGGAITDASAEVFAKLPPAQQAKFLKSYYDPVEGIGYTLARTNMNSCDFSSDSYTYVAENDSSLSTFNISHDEQYRIPLIRKVMQAAGGNLTIYLSPWSPPAWMKDNNDMLHGGKLLPQYRHAWARYYAKFIKAYAAKNIPIWGLTVQNEPMSSQTWESCIYTAEEERDFVRDYLGPEMVRQGLGDKKIIIWDHNRDYMYSFSNTILQDTVAAKYVWGTGYHWYEDWNGGVMRFGEEKKLQDKYPQKNLLFTEGCIGKFDFKNINNWANGEHYGLSIINDFNNGTVGWTDWNILLDEHGGPNHVQNYCFAPVHADTKTGKLIYTSSYYYLGQFSKFIRPGAVRVGSASKENRLLCTAFVNTDGKLAVVVMNNSADKINYTLTVQGYITTVNSLPHSISTLIIN